MTVATSDTIRILFISLSFLEFSFLIDIPRHGVQTQNSAMG